MTRSTFCAATIAAAILSFCLFHPAQAAVPDTLNYQGYLTDLAGSPIDGTMLVTFSIYATDLDGSPLWTGDKLVTFDQGLFSVELGGPGALFPPGLFDTALWLGVAVEGDAEMQPRRPLTTVGFSFRAEGADSIGGRSADLVVSSICELYGLTGNSAARPELCGNCFASLECDDGNECTINTCDNPGTSDAACASTSVADGTPCDGGSNECLAGICAECTPQDTEEQNCDTGDPGFCSLGIWTRTCDANGTWGPFGDCVPVIEPTPEVCDFEDNDCNGIVDDVPDQPVQNGVIVCSDGGEIIICDSLWGDCDGDLSNGCERSLATNNDCGACGVTCPIGNSCSTGTCVAP